MLYLEQDIGQLLAKEGSEYGATTGRPRRIGWFDAVLVKKAVELNGITGLCITKLDILDKLDEIRIHVEADDYIDLPGWMTDTTDIRSITDLPENANRYINEIESHCGVKIDMVSVGPDRDSIIEVNNIFEDK